LQNVGVIQRRNYLRLLLEPPQPFRVPRKRGGQNLDCDVAPEPRVPRAVHLTHAASAER
jgi:hypothetical protein